MKQYTLTIMDNATANFRLTFTCLFERSVNDKTINAVWHNTNLDADGNNKDAYNFKPSCFLNFTFVSPDDYSQTKTLPTALPHIYKIRRAFEAMYNLTLRDDIVIEDNGSLLINPSIDTDVTIDGINLSKGDWINLGLTMLKNVYTGKTEVGVILSTSRTNGYGSGLSLDEFYTLYDIIMHIDYVTLQHQAINIYFAEKAKATAPASSGNSNYNSGRKATPSTYTRQAGGYNGGYNPRQTSSNPGYAPATPNYQSQPAQQQMSAPASKAAQIPTKQVREEAPKANGNPMPNRPATASAPKITMDAMKDIPVDMEDITLDDNSEIEDIFNDLK